MEDQKIESDNRESIKNISQRHLDSIYESFRLWEHYERLMLVGFSDLSDLIQTYNPKMEIGIIQVKNQELLVKEIRNLLIKTKPILNVDKFKIYETRTNVLNQIVLGRYIHNDKVIPYYRWKTSQVEKTKTIILQLGFYIIVEESQNLRKELIEELHHLLFSMIDIKNEVTIRR